MDLRGVQETPIGRERYKFQMVLKDHSLHRGLISCQMLERAGAPAEDAAVRDFSSVRRSATASASRGDIGASFRRALPVRSAKVHYRQYERERAPVILGRNLHASVLYQSGRNLAGACAVRRQVAQRGNVVSGGALSQQGR